MVAAVVRVVVAAVVSVVVAAVVVVSEPSAMSEVAVSMAVMAAASTPVVLAAILTAGKVPLNRFNEFNCLLFRILEDGFKEFCL